MLADVRPRPGRSGPRRPPATPRFGRRRRGRLGSAAALRALITRAPERRGAQRRPTRASSCRSSPPACTPASTTWTWRCRCRARTRERPYELTGVKLGDEQFALAAEWEARGALALVGMGVEPGLSDVFARYAADHLFSSIDERRRPRRRRPGRRRLRLRAHVLDLDHDRGVPQPAGRSGRRDRGWFTTAPFAEPELFDFPEGIGPVECVHVEHEEVLLVPRWVDARRVTFKYGLGAEFIDVLQDAAQARAGPDRAGRRARRPGLAARRGRRLPARPGRRWATGCAGGPAPAPCVTGTGTDGAAARGVPLPGGRQRAVDGASTASRPWSGRPRSTRWSALELIAGGAWSGAGVLGPEALDPVPFLDLLPDYGAPWRQQERTPAAAPEPSTGLAREGIAR